MNIQEHISKVEEAAKRWLSPENVRLKEAIQKTVEEGLFSFEDIKFQIRVLKQQVEAGQITEWANRAGLSDTHHAGGKKVLCLHAGNLPAVGFQDALGVILSGAEYYGKISRKDPYILPSFLEEIREAGLSNHGSFSTSLDSFKSNPVKKVLFAGSQESIPEVKAELKRLNILNQDTELVIRTAKFSMAYITNEDPEVITDLVEAIFRYGGQGCRSVAVVVSPIRFNSLKCHFQDYVEAFWLKNPQQQKPEPALEYQFAYNKAVDLPQAWMNDFLIQESEEKPDQDYILHWIQGDEEKLKELKARYGEAVQTVYTAGEKVEGLRTEFLSQAQRPPLWWEPDGIGVIEAVIRQ